MRKRKVTFRRVPRATGMEFFEHMYIGGPNQSVRYIYVGKLLIKIRKFA